MPSSFAGRLIAYCLQLAARLTLWRTRPTVIAVVGPVGKTSLKDAVFAALAPFGSVRKSAGNFNTSLSVPCAVIGIDVPRRPWGWALAVARAWWAALTVRARHYPRWLVLELGVDAPGDMSAFTWWLHPHLVVLARFPSPPPHVEFFPSEEALFAEELAILDVLQPGGVVVAPQEDWERLAPMVRQASSRPIVLTYGRKKGAVVRVREVRMLWSRRRGVQVPRGVRATLESSLTTEREVVHRRGTLGLPPLMAVAGAAAVRLALGYPLAGLRRAVAHLTPPPGRLRLFEGVGGSVVLDDSYNASPGALQAALDALATLPQQNRVVILGDMLELGDATPHAHEAAGKAIARVASILIAVGPRARYAARAARAEGMQAVWEVNDALEAARLARSRTQWHAPTTAWLIKGSRGVRLETVARALLAHPYRDAAFLVGE